MQSQGAPSIQGDAYTTHCEDRASRSNDDYNSEAYCQYAIEFPTAASGEVWRFDPGFCHVDSDKVTGENWSTGSSQGHSPYQPVSAFFDPCGSRNARYHTPDDVRVASSGPTFKRIYMRDHDLEVDPRGSPVHLVIP